MFNVKEIVMITLDQAVNKLMYAPRAVLLAFVNDGSNQIYGHPARSYVTATVPELVNWIISHYSWSGSEFYIKPEYQQSDKVA